MPLVEWLGCIYAVEFLFEPAEKLFSTPQSLPFLRYSARGERIALTLLASRLPLLSPIPPHASRTTKMATATAQATPTLSSEKEKLTEEQQEYSPDERIWRPVFEPGTADTDGPLTSATMRAFTPGILGLTPVEINMLRDNFSLTTWLLMGACLQGLALLIFPVSRALAPALLLLGYRLVINVLQIFGVLENPYMKGVILGKWSRHEPDEQGLLRGVPSRKPVIVFCEWG
jgi:hypothetical protein